MQLIKGRILAGCSAALLLIGCPSGEPTELGKQTKDKRDPGLMGYYIHDDPTFYGVTDIKDAPFMHLGIEGKRWMMVNMLTGYGGTWTESGGVGTLTVNMGPTGKAKGNEKITAKRTERGVELAIAGKSDRAMHFTYVSPNTPNGFDYDEFLGKP